jgi:hypothetical protein
MTIATARPGRPPAFAFAVGSFRPGLVDDPSWGVTAHRAVPRDGPEADRASEAWFVLFAAPM